MNEPAVFKSRAITKKTKRSHTHKCVSLDLGHLVNKRSEEKNQDTLKYSTYSTYTYTESKESDWLDWYRDRDGFAYT